MARGVHRWFETEYKTYKINPYHYQMKKQCKVCDYKNAVRYGRADWRCPDCDRQLMLELVLMHEAENPQETKEVCARCGKPKSEFLGNWCMECFKEVEEQENKRIAEMEVPNKNIEGWEEEYVKLMRTGMHLEEQIKFIRNLLQAQRSELEHKTRTMFTKDEVEGMKAGWVKEIEGLKAELEDCEINREI